MFGLGRGMRRGFPGVLGRTRRGSGLLLLFLQLMQIGIDNIPPITLSLIVFQTLLYFYQADSYWHHEDLVDICISSYYVINKGQVARLIYAAFLHVDDYHLYYNMSSLAWKGRQLEPIYGCRKFAMNIALLVFLSGFYYISIVQGLWAIFGEHAPLVGPDCVVGFSSVLFGLKVLLAKDGPGGSSRMLGFTVPNHSIFWVELLLIQVITPNVSFLGHLCGILAGLTISSGSLQRFHNVFASHISLPRGNHQPRFQGVPRATGYHNNSRAEHVSESSNRPKDINEQTSITRNIPCIMAGCSYRARTGSELNDHINAMHWIEENIEYDDSSMRTTQGHEENVESDVESDDSTMRTTQGHEEDILVQEERSDNTRLDAVRAARLARFSIHHR